MVALRGRRLSAGSWALGGLLVLLAPSLLGDSGDFWESYRSGVEAIEAQRWAVAEERMREALAGRSEEDGKLFRRGIPRRYFPHYYLGVALFESGDCAGALESWSESERQGMITRRRNLYGNLLESREECQEQAPVATTRAPIEESVETERPSRPPPPATGGQSRRVDTEPPSRPAAEPTRAVSPPPPELDSAARAFLAGDYPRVIEILGDFEIEEKGAMAHVHLLRSAALFALHRIRNDAELLILARGEAREALSKKPDLGLPERYFSPQFRELLETLDVSDGES